MNKDCTIVCLLYHWKKQTKEVKTSAKCKKNNRKKNIILRNCNNCNKIKTKEESKHIRLGLK